MFLKEAKHTLMVLAVLPMFLDLCRPDPVTKIDVSDIFWSAWRNPESFDDWLAGQTIDPGAAGCLRSRAEAAFDASEARLRECNQLLSPSTAWNECQQESEQLHNSGVVLNDIARTIEGRTRFENTDSYQILIWGKDLAGAATWNALADALRDLMPPLECER